MSIELVMPFNHLILCPAFLLLPSIFPSIQVFSNELALSIRWPNYWSFSFSTSPSNEHSGRFPVGWTGLISLQSKGPSRVFSNTTVRKHQFFGIFYKREKWHGYCEAENKRYLYSVYHTWTSLVWWLSGKEPTCQCRRHGINPWSGKIPHTAGQLSLSHLYANTGTTLAFTRQTFVGRVMSLLFNMLSRPVIAILPRNKHLGDWEKSIYTFLWLTHESF